MTATKSALWPALMAARAAIPAIPKTADNPFFKSKYAPLGAILEKVCPILREHGLYLYGHADGDAFCTVIVHADSGDSVTDRRPFADAHKPQEFGAASSYSFRYGISALLALELEDDTDGNMPGSPAKGSGSGQAASNRPTTAPQSGKAGGAKEACPKCGAVGFIRRLSKGKNAGRWSCMDWFEKGFQGCGAIFNENPTRAREISREIKADRSADDFLAPVRQPGQERTDEPPPPSDEDLPF